MDLEHFVANRELLERLSREYELLKASGADVDYPAWVRQRLREAAAEIAAKAVTAPVVDTSIDAVQPLQQPGGSASLPTQEVAVQASPNNEQLSLARHPGGVRHANRPPRALEFESAAAHPGSAWFLQGEGTSTIASEALKTAIYGPAGPGLPSALATKKSTKKQKRVVIVSPRKSPAQRQPVPSPYRTTLVTSPYQRKPPPQSAHAAARTQAPPISKLYTPQEPGLFTARPDAYVHPEARPRRTSPASKRPDWVNAASLQAALRGAASAVPHLQAAAERERRLALSTALARQTLAAGLGADDARAVALHGTSPAAASAAHSQYDHVLQVAQMLARHNEQLARAVQQNSEQLAKQQQLLESTLVKSPTKEAADGQGGAGAEAPAAPRVEVETGPPAWFVRRPGAGTAAGGKARSKSPAGGGTLPKSPSKGTQTGPRTRSGTQLPAGTTAKERERATRKESLKALLKQVLDGAGLAGGKEGRRRLASGMAEAEKLVAAIQALAQIKKAKGGKLADPTSAMSAVAPDKELAAAGTQTSGPASAASGRSYPGTGSESGAGGASSANGGSTAPSRAVSRKSAAESAGLEPGDRRASGGSRAPSRAPSQGGLRLATAGKEDSDEGAAARPLSRQGSGETTSSDNDRPAAAPDPTLPAADTQEERPRRPRWVRSTDGSESSGAPGAHTAADAGSTGSAEPSHQGPEDEEAAAAARGSSPSNSRTGSLSAGATSHGARRTSPSRRPVPGQAAWASNPGPIVIPSSIPARHTASAAAAEGPPGVSPGVMLDSLEDQVQQIVQRDAAAFAEASRFSKIDALEQRLHSLVDKVENKLVRALQPLQLNGQSAQQNSQLQQQQQIQHLQQLANLLGLAPTGEGGGLVLGVAAGAGAGSSVVGPGGAGGSTGVVAAGSVRAGGQGYGGHGEGVMSPRSAGLSVLELQRMLIQLNRMESNEQEIRRKWFHDTLGPRRTGPITRPIVVRDGQLGTLDPDDPSSPPQPMTTTVTAAAPANTSPGRAPRATSPGAGRSGPFWSFAQPPTESVLATVAAVSTTTRSIGVGGAAGCGGANGAGGAPGSRQARDGTAEADDSLADPISDAVLESVLRGRRRFLRAQRLADGDLVASADPSLNPVQIMEDVTDALLDEMLREQAQELASLCDGLGEHMVKGELKADEDDEEEGDAEGLSEQRTGQTGKRAASRSRGLR